MRATSDLAGRDMMAATLEWEDDDKIAMVNGRKKDCTESKGKTLNRKRERLSQTKIVPNKELEDTS